MSRPVCGRCLTKHIEHIRVALTKKRKSRKWEEVKKKITGKLWKRGKREGKRKRCEKMENWRKNGKKAEKRSISPVCSNLWIQESKSDQLTLVLNNLSVPFSSAHVTHGG